MKGEERLLENCSPKLSYALARPQGSSQSGPWRPPACDSCTTNAARPRRSLISRDSHTYYCESSTHFIISHRIAPSAMHSAAASREAAPSFSVSLWGPAHRCEPQAQTSITLRAALRPNTLTLTGFVSRDWGHQGPMVQGASAISFSRGASCPLNNPPRCSRCGQVR